MLVSINDPFTHENIGITHGILIIDKEINILEKHLKEIIFNLKPFISSNDSPAVMSKWTVGQEWCYSFCLQISLEASFKQTKK